MQRVIDSTAASSLPSPPALTGTTGYFTEGSPGITPATRVRGWWTNMIQEELLSLLTAANITPDASATNFTQVLQAIRQLSRAPNVNVYKIISGAQNVSVNGGAFTTTGATSFTPTYNSIGKVRLIGAGGGSGGAAGTGASGAGAAGSYGEAKVTLVSGTPITVTVGQGGIAGATTTSDGGIGGNTVFGGITAPGGGGSGHALTGTAGAGAAASAAVTGTGVYLSIIGASGGSAGSVASGFLPGQGPGTPFGQGGFANTNSVALENFGAGAGGAQGGAIATGCTAVGGVVILEY